ncbi:glycosyltransferase family 2 protein [Patescibacteria group bacterium]|nr:glycosyltransferase family 2 protein [Patescibacteria group bacterium]
MEIAAVIPAYNVASTIGDIVESTKKYVDTVVVVDNNSIDETARIAKEAGALIFKQPIQGAGAATRLGLNAVSHDYDIVVTLDGDGQHIPEGISWLLEQMENSHADMAIGSRFLNIIDDSMPRYRKFGIDVITWLYNIGSKQKVSDSLCCFRAFKKEVVQNIEITEDGFGFSTEMLMKARKAGARIIEVPVSCVYHKDRRRNSVLNPVKQGIILAWKTIYWRLKIDG